MKKFIVHIQSTFPFLGLIGVLLGVLGWVNLYFEHKNFVYLHYYYGCVKDTEHFLSISEFLLPISFLLGFIFSILPLPLYVLGLYRWGKGNQSVKKEVILSLVGSLSIIVIYFYPLYMPSEIDYYKDDNLKFVISKVIYIDRQSKDDHGGGVNNCLKYFPADSPFKNYHLPMPLIEKQKLLREIDEWWRINKNYLFWDDKTNKFKMDEEAKAAFIWTDEYRKTHPWPKENTPK
jgi:hypothetical protein